MSSQISSHLQTFVCHFRTSLSHLATDLDIITAKNADDVFCCTVCILNLMFTVLTDQQSFANFRLSFLHFFKSPNLDSITAKLARRRLCYSFFDWAIVPLSKDTLFKFLMVTISMCTYSCLLMWQHARYICMDKVFLF